MNARYYNSETGQFISKDTYLGEAYSPWTQNLYSYTGNNPVNFTDPTGHSFVAVATIVGIAVGASIGAYRSYKKTGKVSVKSVIKGGIIGGAAGFALGGVIAAGTTGSVLAPTAKVLAGAKTIAGAGSIGAGISAIADNFKAAGSEIVNWAGNVFGGGRKKVDLYRSVCDAEAQDIKSKGIFDTKVGHFEGKQFGFSYDEVEKFGKIFKQDIIVKTSVPKSFIQQYAQYGIDTQIFKSGVVTIPKEAMGVFNKLITAIKFVSK